MNTIEGELITSGAAESDDEESGLMGLLADLEGAGGGSEVKIYRVPKDGKYHNRMIYIGSCLPAEFSFDMLQRPPYNGGDFRVHVRKGGKLISNRPVSVEPRPDLEPVKSQSVDSGIGTLAAIMQDGFAKMAAMLAETVRQNQPAPQKSALELAQELMIYKELFSSNQPAQNPMDMMRTVFDLAKEINPPPDDGSGMGVLMKSLEMFGPILQSAVSQPQPPAQHHAPMRAIPLPAQAPMRPATSAQAPAQVAMPVQPQPQPQPQAPANPDPKGRAMQNIQSSLSLLINAARNGSNPEVYGELILDYVGVDEAIRLINMPNWFEALQALNGEVSAHRAWFEEIRAYLLEVTALTGDEAAADTTDTTTSGE